VSLTAIQLPVGKTALLVMDVQNDIVHMDGKLGGELGAGAMPRLIAEKNILHNIADLMTASRIAGVPIIHVRHVYRPDYLDMPNNISIFRTIKKIGALSDGSWGAEIHEMLKPAAEDFVVDKTRISAFYASTLAGLLEAQDLTHLIMTGIATDGVIDGTARDAADRGYHVTIPSDCCASTSEKAHNTILHGVLALIAKVCDSSELIAALGAVREG
jgi:nicotinamidase-related amidase